MNNVCDPCNPPAHGVVSAGNFFGPGSATNFSAPFEVKDRPLILTAVGLEAGTHIIIENIFGCGLGEDFSPVLDTCCKPLKLNTCNPQQIVVLTGRYRLSLIVDAGVTFAPADVTVYSRFNNGRLPEGVLSMSCNCDTPAAAPTALEVADSICSSSGAKTILQGCLAIAPSGAAGGTLSGTYPNPGINAVAAADSLAASSTATSTLANALAGNAAAASTLAAALGPILDANDTVMHDATMVGNGTAGTLLGVSATGVVSAIAAQVTALNTLAVALGPIIGAAAFPTSAPLTAANPTVNSNNTIPTQHYGSNAKYLGEPTGFYNIGGNRVPYYN